MFPANFEKEFPDQLITVPKNALLFKVYAKAEPLSEKVLIGELHLNSEIIKSNFADTELFFQHQDVFIDLALKPEWRSAFP